MDVSDELKKQIDAWNDDFKYQDPVSVLSFFLKEYAGEIAFATSLGAEDQVITDLLVRSGQPADIFTLDTGRLFPETYELLEETSKKYDLQINVFFPDQEQVESMVNEKGINLFYNSIENRKLCCGIRKVEPLKRAFAGKKAWISGLRKDQTVSRFFSRLVEWDEVNGLLKINPLIDWTEKDVWDYIKEHEIPYNPLHKEGFVSIGCQPCTRAIKPGEDFRAGRWWWEQQDQKECGLHQR